MKFGFRKPSLKKRVAARTSVKRYVRHSLGVKAPRGMGLFTNPKKALYNKIYNKTTFGLEFFGKKRRSTRKNHSSGNHVDGSEQGCLIILGVMIAVGLLIWLFST